MASYPQERHCGGVAMPCEPRQRRWAVPVDARACCACSASRQGVAPALCSRGGTCARPGTACTAAAAAWCCPSATASPASRWTPPWCGRLQTKIVYMGSASWSLLLGVSCCKLPAADQTHAGWEPHQACRNFKAGLEPTFGLWMWVMGPRPSSGITLSRSPAAPTRAGRVSADDAAHERARVRHHLLRQRGQQSVLGRRHDPVRARPCFPRQPQSL